MCETETFFFYGKSHEHKAPVLNWLQCNKIKIKWNLVYFSIHRFISYFLRLLRLTMKVGKLVFMWKVKIFFSMSWFSFVTHRRNQTHNRLWQIVHEKQITKIIIQYLFFLCMPVSENNFSQNKNILCRMKQWGRKVIYPLSNNPNRLMN